MPGKSDAFEKLIDRRFNSMTRSAPQKLDDGSVVYTLSHTGRGGR